MAQAAGTLTESCILEFIPCLKFEIVNKYIATQKKVLPGLQLEYGNEPHLVHQPHEIIIYKMEPD